MTAADRLDGVDMARALALVAVLVALAASLQVMYHFIDVVGVPVVFLTIVAASLVAATVIARLLPPRPAVAVGVALLGGGLTWYLSQIVGSPPWFALLVDTLSLLGGRSLLQISNIRAWVLGVTAAPVFLTWYFALRSWYAAAVAVAGGTLAFLVLTGDADVVTTLTGVVAGAAALGLGDFERRGEPIARAETVLVVASVMILVPSVVSVVPATAGAAGPLMPGLDRPTTVEGNLLTANEELSVQGDIRLSPEVRFTVTSEESRYWRVGSYDRYTGGGWVRTGGTSPYQGRERRNPPGPNRTVEQTFRVETRSEAVPAAWKPIEVTGVPSTQVRDDGSFEPGEPLESGDEYQVRSRVPNASPRQLQNASTDYPAPIADRYTQLPESTPDRVARRTERLTANAETSYETATVVEQWLRNNKNYSLDVNRPRGNVADAFLFEMDAGYCTYYATAMVAMLRTQGVPARFVVGYAPGERVDDDRWVVRGLNSHAWVEVYFPDYGWVQFDPTPARPREEARDRAVQRARGNNVSSVDTGDTRGTDEWTPTPTRTPEPLTGAGPNGSSGDGEPGARSPTLPEGATPTDYGVTDDGETLAVNTPGGGEAVGVTDGGDDGTRLPTGQQFALGLVALFGAVLGVRRSGAVQRAYRAIWVRYQPRTEPARDAERAFQRLQYYLGQRHYRPRWDDETVRDYLESVDAGPAARRVAEIRERARYGGEVTRADADEAVRLVNDLVR